LFHFVFQLNPQHTQTETGNACGPARRSALGSGGPEGQSIFYYGKQKTCGYITKLLNSLHHYRVRGKL
jgi:hypothetical protein